MKNCQRFLVAINLLFSPFFLKSQVKITMDNVKATYAAGEKAAFRISSNVFGTGSYSIWYDPRDESSVIKKGSFTIQQGRSDTVVLFNLPHPGAIFFKAEQNGQVAWVSAVFDPHNIQPIETEPSDFDDFWKKEKEKLKAIPINPQLTLKNTLPNGSKLYVLRLDNVDGRTVNGYIAIPAGSGKFPAIIQLPPFGTVPFEPDGFVVTDFAEKCKSIIVQLTVHNTPPNQEDSNAYKPNDLTDPTKFYNRWMVLGGLRAIDYVASRPDFNGSLGLCGNSQGGGLSITLAGLDERVKAVLAIAPANSEQQGTRYHRASGFPRYNIQGASLGMDTNKVKIASKYHDAVYFLKRYKGALMIQTGYKDDVTPTATHFAAYNQYLGAATMLHLREIGHNYPEEYWFGRYSFFHQHLTGFENPFSFKKTYDIQAGEDQKEVLLDSVILRGRVYKDGVLNDSLPVLWEKVSGVGDVSFENTKSRATKVKCSEAGTYVFRFSSEDDYLIKDPNQAKYYSMRDLVTVTVKKKDDNSGGSVDAEVKGIRVFPNPSTGIFRVKWESIYSYKRLHVFNSKGLLVYETPISTDVKEIKLDLSRFQDGNYMLTFTNIYNRSVTKHVLKATKD
ncbi:MAG: acetylxylan esterase [Saprospiraceae bacterium]|nr:acetylxylan esterase [Saprospiraceae bacterium]